MSRRNRMGYKKYQGRGGAGSFLLKMLVGVLAVLVVGGGGYLLAKQDALRLPDLPAGDGTAQATQNTQQEPQPTQTQDDPDQTQQPTPTPSPTPAPTPAVSQIRALEVTVSQLLDGSAQRRVEQAGCDALVVEVKGQKGTLQWPSQVAQARQWGAVSSQKSLTQALDALSQQGIHLVARMDCFRDQLLANVNVEDSVLLAKSGRPWYDFWGMRWVSPTNQAVRDYLVALCVELAGMGFDELVLNGAYYPDEGEVYALATSPIYPELRSASVEQFWKEVSTALEDSSVVLSAQVRGASVVDAGAASGLSPQILEQYAQRVWVSVQKGEQTQVESVLTQAGVEANRQMIKQSVSGQTIWG